MPAEEKVAEISYIRSPCAVGAGAYFIIGNKQYGIVPGGKERCLEKRKYRL